MRVGWGDREVGGCCVRVGCAVFSRGGLCVCSAAADPIGVALLITAGKRSVPADKNYHTTPTPGGSHFMSASCGRRDAWLRAVVVDCAALSAGMPVAYPR